jgi:hypothetical protein
MSSITNIIGWLKKVSRIEHTHRHSFLNFMVNLVYWMIDDYILPSTEEGMPEKYLNNLIAISPYKMHP